MKSRLLFALLIAATAAAQAQTKPSAGKFSDNIVNIGLILDMPSLYAEDQADLDDVVGEFPRRGLGLCLRSGSGGDQQGEKQSGFHGDPPMFTLSCTPCSKTKW